MTASSRKKGSKLQAALRDRQARMFGPAQQLPLFETGVDSRSLTASPSQRPDPVLHPKPISSRKSMVSRFVVLGSGSGGNCVLVQGPSGHLLIDAGFSCRNTEQRLRLVGVEPRLVKAILLTHEHGDHCRGVARFVRRFRPKVYGTRRTFHGKAVRHLRYEEVELDRPFMVAGLQVTAFPVPHDARDPVGYVLEDPEGFRLGLASDLGCRTQRSWRALRDLDALIIEANHDPHMLETGPYPFSLKRRVASRTGHLSNEDASLGVSQLVSERLHTVVPYHLSRTNNRPELAKQALLEQLLIDGASEIEVLMSDQFTPSEWRPFRDPRLRMEVAGKQVEANL